MKIIKPSATIKQPELLKNSLQQIEYAARISHRSENIQKPENTLDFIQKVIMDRGDWSVVEHITAQVEIICDRGISHEIVRHRLFSYTHESTRFVNYKNKIEPSFIYPQVNIECPYCLDGNELSESTSCFREIDKTPFYHCITPGDCRECKYDFDWLKSIQESEKRYKSLIERGWRPQEARSVFPNALASKLLMTGNLRNWRNFFLKRTTKQSHPQMREITIPLLEDFQKLIPIIFDDIIPNSNQIDNIRKGC